MELDFEVHFHTPLNEPGVARGKCGLMTKWENGEMGNIFNWPKTGVKNQKTPFFILSLEIPNLFCETKQIVFPSQVYF